MMAIHEESSIWDGKADGVGCVHRRYQHFQRQEREISSKNRIKKSLERDEFTTLRRRTLGFQATLRPATPQRKLRKTKEDGIERKDGMYDVEQSSRRNKSIIINPDQRTCVRRFWPMSRHLLLL